MPSALRSSEQKAMPRGDRVVGLRSRAGRPSTATVPESARSAPNSSRASSVRPEPSRPARPTHLAGGARRGRPARWPPCDPARGGEHRGVGQLGDVGGRLAVEVGRARPAPGRPSSAPARAARARRAGTRRPACRCAARDRGRRSRRPGRGSARRRGSRRPASRRSRITRNSSLDLVGVEARGRLVEDQHRGVEVDRPGDRDQLLDGERVARRAASPGRWSRSRRASSSAARRRIGAPVDAAEPARLAAEQDVLRHR